MAKKRRLKRAARKNKPKAQIKRKAKAKSASKTTAGPRVRKRHISASEKAQTVPYDTKGLGARSGGQSGDLQGLSDIEGAGSESIEELIEEGNSFEAEVLQGVERAADADEEEVRTNEVSEDDVPEEYRDQERRDRL